MMRIGILTYHRSHNFGALFQAIASRRYLEFLGHDVYYINYWPDYHKAMYAPFSFWAFCRMGWDSKLYYIRVSIRKYKDNIKRTKQYNQFINKFLKPYYASKGMSFDVIFYGSDQIWRKQPYINDFNPVYFAKHSFPAKLHVALSASAGLLPDSETEKKKFKSLLKNFDRISVREMSLLELVEACGYKAQLTCDPALFLTAEQWNEIFPNSGIKQNKYLLLVNYIEGSFNIDAVKSLAKKMGLDYVCIDGSMIQHPAEGDLSNVAPLELFNYIRNADFVCTSSFHVLVFSILYHKQCLAAFKQNAKRAESLLCELGIKSRLLDYDSKIITLGGEIDYHDVDIRLLNLRNQAFNYIHQSLLELVDEE